MLLKPVYKILEPFFKSPEDRKKLVNVIIPSFFTHFLAALMTLGLTLYLTRNLGSKGYGVFTYSFTVVSTLVNLATFGICTITLRETPLFIASGNRALWKGFHFWGLRLVIFLCLLAAMLLCLYNLIIVHLLHIGDETVYTIPLALASVSIPFFGLMNYYSFSVLGQHKSVLSFLPDNVVKPVIFIILLLIFRYVAKGFDLPDVIIFNVISFVGGFAFIYLAFRKNVHFTGIKKEADNETWNRNLRSFFLLAGIISINSRIDVIILGLLKDASQVGIYNAAARVASSLTFFLYIMNSISAPRISQLYKDEQKEHLQLLITRIIRGVMALTLPCGLILIFFRHFIMGIFGAGGEYIPGSPALVILSTGYIINIIFGPVATVAMMTGNEHYNSIFTVISIIVNVLLALILTPVYGFIGTAIAQAVSLLFWNAGMFLLIKKKVGIRTWIFG